MSILTKNTIYAVLLFSLCGISFAEVAVVVNPGNSNTLSQEDIQNIYLIKTKVFPNGKPAIPIDQTEGADIRVEFVSKVLDKNEQQLKSYWSRLIFTGRAAPPKILSSDAEVKELVNRNVDAIGFINTGSVDDSVKVVATF